MKKEIYFAGGCFWGLEKAFKMVNGVTETTVGFSNSNTPSPSYKLVCTGTTDSRETVKIIYEEEEVSLNRLLDYFFLCIDPTQKNQQGHDIGTQYQTGVYYTDEADLPLIRERFDEEAKKYPVFYVELRKLENFFDAEDYHQDYLDKNPQGYCHIPLDIYKRIREMQK